MKTREENLQWQWPKQVHWLSCPRNGGFICQQLGEIWEVQASQ